MKATLFALLMMVTADVALDQGAQTSRVIALLSHFCHATASATRESLFAA